MPLTYALNTFGLAFATLSSLVVWMVLEQNQFIIAAVKRMRTIIVRPFRSEKMFTPSKPQGYRDVPMWWYGISTAVSIFLAIFCVEYWHVQLRWYGVLLALAVTLVFFVPVSIDMSMPNQCPAKRTEKADFGGIRYIQYQSQYRHVLPDCLWFCLSRESAREHLVLQSGLYLCHQGTWDGSRFEVGGLL